ncbi:hypothetical protein CLOP_g3848 [Closterium sp. NIES-67]|nr:hypothetical protein CLOP_g3848 [Closterium sp. NIES-67]
MPHSLDAVGSPSRSQSSSLAVKPWSAEVSPPSQLGTSPGVPSKFRFGTHICVGEFSRADGLCQIRRIVLE